MSFSSADLDFADQNRGGKVDRYALGYQAGVVQALSVVRDFMDEKGFDIPHGLNDAVLSLLDGETN